MPAATGGAGGGGALPHVCPMCGSRLVVAAPSAVNREQHVAAECRECGQRVTEAVLETLPYIWGGGGVPTQVAAQISVGTTMRPFLGASAGLAGNPFLKHLGPPMPRPDSCGDDILVDDPFDAKRAPDLFEPVLAWRGWRPTGDGHLTAAAQGGIWDEGENLAVCNRYDHLDIPAVDCSCGFYGWHRPEDIQHGELRGCFKAWGEIISHDVGIRSEYAEIIVLYDAERIETKILARIADRYKVPIMGTQAEALAYAVEHGVAVPMEKRAEPPRPVDKWEAASFTGEALRRLNEAPAEPAPTPVPKSQIVVHIHADTKKLMEELKPISKALNEAIQSMSQQMIAAGMTAREARDGFFKLMEADRKAKKKNKVVSAEQRRQLAKKHLGE